jgi:threonine dehydrogenase-like Zn-dependent dehydrogenase
VVRAAARARHRRRAHRLAGRAARRAARVGGARAGPADRRPKPALVRDLGATYHAEPVDAVTQKARPDVVIEATGVGQVVFDALAGLDPYGIICLTGVSPVGRTLTVDAGALNRDIVLENNVVVGSVNANLEHYAAAAAALAQADLDWLHRLITRRVPLAHVDAAFQGGADDVKVVIDLAAST